jgi:hypothetical protein
MNIPHAFKLNFDVSEALNTSWILPFNPTEYFFGVYDSRKEWECIVNSEFIDILEKTLPINRIIVFNKPSSFTGEDVHTDGQEDGKDILYALNIVPYVFDQPSYMEWFSINNTNIVKEFSYIGGANYFHWHKDEVSLLEKISIDGIITIVRTDVPHRISVGNGNRLCISIRFRDNMTDWKEVYDFFLRMGLVESTII